jgi:hypothetical protein
MATVMVARDVDAHVYVWFTAHSQHYRHVFLFHQKMISAGGTPSERDYNQEQLGVAGKMGEEI